MFEKGADGNYEQRDSIPGQMAGVKYTGGSISPDGDILAFSHKQGVEIFKYRAENHSFEPVSLIPPQEGAPGFKFVGLTEKEIFLSDEDNNLKYIPFSYDLI